MADTFRYSACICTVAIICCAVRKCLRAGMSGGTGWVDSMWSCDACLKSHICVLIQLCDLVGAGCV